jgi:hypothetical protein
MTTKFCAIIPDRKDRPELTDFCLKQLRRMSVYPDQVYHMSYIPEMCGEFDLVSRVRSGVSEAMKDGFDWCFIIENDDYYPVNYFERFLPYLNRHDFIGDQLTTYYNLRNLTYQRFNHPFRSSLFTTAFRISALNNFEWPGDVNPFLDIELWKYARFKRRAFINTGAVGMKHGLGLCGGKGHVMNMKESDWNLSWLEKNVDEMSFQFYKGLVEKLKEKVI